jgi:hypothetical protein
MNIFQLYNFLSIENKIELLDLLNNDAEVISFNHNIKISEWLKMMKDKDISMRLYNALYSAYCYNDLRDIRINDIEKMDILSRKNAGKKCWQEFVKLREEYNGSIKK